MNSEMFFRNQKSITDGVMRGLGMELEPLVSDDEFDEDIPEEERIPADDLSTPSEAEKNGQY